MNCINRSSVTHLKSWPASRLRFWDPKWTSHQTIINDPPKRMICLLTTCNLRPGVGSCASWQQPSSTECWIPVAFGTSGNLDQIALRKFSSGAEAGGQVSEDVWPTYASRNHAKPRRIICEVLQATEGREKRASQDFHVSGFNFLAYRLYRFMLDRKFLYFSNFRWLINSEVEAFQDLQEVLLIGSLGILRPEIWLLQIQKSWGSTWPLPQCPSISACQRPHLWSQVLPSATMLYWAYLMALKPDAVSAVSSCSQYLANMSLCTWYSKRTSSSWKRDTKLSIYGHFHSLSILTFDLWGMQAFWMHRFPSYLSLDWSSQMIDESIPCVWKNSVANVACSLS